VTQTELHAGVPANLTIRRGGAETTLVLIPDQICIYPVVLGSSDEVNACRRAGIHLQLHFPDELAPRRDFISHEGTEFGR